MRATEARQLIVLLESHHERQELAMALYEAVATLLDTAPDGRPHNWRSDPRSLITLYNLLRDPEWRPL